jgi:hypothetical protein
MGVILHIVLIVLAVNRVYSNEKTVRLAPNMAWLECDNP